MVKLDTYGDVMRWLASKCAHGPLDWNDDTAFVARYLAECVRLRKAWEEIQEGPYTHAQLVARLCRAKMEGGRNG
jgi:hypothetical protein